jgi:hypothetical protein
MVLHGAVEVPALASLPVVDTKNVKPDLDGTCSVTVAEADLVESA